MIFQFWIREKKNLRKIERGAWHFVVKSRLPLVYDIHSVKNEHRHSPRHSLSSAKNIFNQHSRET